MNYLGPTTRPRLNEAVAVVFLFAGLFVFISLASYHPFDPSLNTATGLSKAGNLTGRVGAFLSDFLFQTLGLGAYAIPVLLAIALGFGVSVFGFLQYRATADDRPPIWRKPI